MTSLRKRLFFILVAATGIIWLSAVAWIYANSRSELEHVLDTRLHEAASMVHSLVATGTMPSSMNLADAMSLPQSHSGYERQLSCQIWSLDGKLVSRSSGAPDTVLSDNQTGFSDRVVNGELWRVFTIVDEVKAVRVMVGDRLGLRDRLVNGLILGLLAPALLILPLLGLLIWVSLGRGLRPLYLLADTVRNKSADDMRPITTSNIPLEVRPLADALNSLFGKVETARRHEREVTAFAAHELRTPLAGLKTQAQIALAAQDPQIKEEALRQILLSVDRTTRLVRQLLALAKLDAEAETQLVERVNLGQIAEEIIAQNPLITRKVRNFIDPVLFQMSITTDRHNLTLALRNLYENATHHSPNPVEIRWDALNSLKDASDIAIHDNGPGIAIRDNGPGVLEEELQMLTQRFYRGSNKSQTGTGLGLTIVDSAVKRLGARLIIRNRKDMRGFEALLRWKSD